VKDKKTDIKIIVAGSRTFNNYVLVKYYLDKIINNRTNIEIVSGGARGADYLGEKYAKEHSLNLSSFPADWTKYGKSAGFVRNREMAIYADVLVAFWDGNSKGTRHMINLAKENNLKTKIIKI
jgi:hypothetical protein